MKSPFIAGVVMLKTLAIRGIVGIPGTTNLDSLCFGGKALNI